MTSRQNYMLKLMPCANYGRPLSVVRISVLPEVSQIGYRDRVVPYRLWRFCATSERPRRSKTKCVIITISLSVTHIYIYILYIIKYYIYIYRNSQTWILQNHGWVLTTTLHLTMSSNICLNVEPPLFPSSKTRLHLVLVALVVTKPQFHAWYPTFSPKMTRM